MPRNYLSFNKIFMDDDRVASFLICNASNCPRNHNFKVIRINGSRVKSEVAGFLVFSHIR